MLRYQADRRTLSAVASYFIVAIGSWWVPLDSWALVAAAVALNMVLSFTCAVITHNTIHHPIFVDRRWNRFFQIVLSLTYGHPVSAYVAGHNLSHHKFAQTERDAIRTSKLRFRWNLLNQLLFFYVVAPGIVKGESAFISKMKKERPRWYRQYRIEAAIVFGVTAALILLDWKRALLFFVLPHHYAGWGIVGTNFWQHDGCDENHEFNHSRNFVGRWINFITFNNGFHGMHHMRPGLHWSLLREAHQKDLAPHVHPSLEQRSLLAYLWRTCGWPAKRLDYLGRPVVLPQQADREWVASINLMADAVHLGSEQDGYTAKAMLSSADVAPSRR